MPFLTDEIVRAIKHDLWHGVFQDALARKHGVTQTTISRISRGEQWPDVKWPDGSRGPLSLERKREIRLLRGVAAPVPLLTEEDETRQEIAHQVGEVEQEMADNDLVSAITGGATKEDLLKGLLDRKKGFSK